MTNSKSGTGMKKIIFTEMAPRPVGPYSQAVEKNGMLFIAGQVPVNPEQGRWCREGFRSRPVRLWKIRGRF